MALSTITRWARSSHFCAVVLLLSPGFSTGFRATPYNFVQLRNAGQRSWTQRSAAPLETLESTFENEENEVFVSNYKRGQPITFSVLRFGPMGASVSIDDDAAYGLVLQREIELFRESRDGMDVTVGEVIEGYVERVRDDGKIDVSIRPLGVSRIVVVKQLVFDAIEGSPSGSIPLGDKSTPEDIASYFHGISKKDFKNAIGSLYREGLVAPGGLITSLVADENRRTNKIAAEATKTSKRPEGEGVKPPRLASDRDLSCTVFIGNLPNKITRDEVLRVVIKKLGKDAVTDLRLSLDENKRPRGFGYIQLKEEGMVESAIRDLNGLDVGGRILRSDYADPSRKQKTSTESAPSSFAPSTPAATGEEAVSAWKSGFKNPLLSVKAPASTSASSASAGPSFSKTPSTPSTSSFTPSGASSVSSGSSLSSIGSSVSSGSIPVGATPSSSIPRTATPGGGSLMGVMTGEKRALRDAAGERGTAVKPKEVPESKSWVKEAERSLKFRKPTSPSSYSLTTAMSRKIGKPASTLFFGNLSLQLDEKALKNQIEMFTGPGSVASVRFPTDKDSDKSKGYAYVDIYNINDARRIFEEMHGYEMMGKNCNIDDATRN